MALTLAVARHRGLLRQHCLLAAAAVEVPLAASLCRLLAVVQSLLAEAAEVGPAVVQAPPC